MDFRNESVAVARAYDDHPVRKVVGFFGGAGFISLLCCLLLASLTGCKGGGTPTTPILPPPQDGYEALPATHQLAEVGGKTVAVWATMGIVFPLRGSTVQVGGSCGPNGCLSVPISVRCGTGGNGASIRGFWSRDGVSQDEIAMATAVGPGKEISDTLQQYSLSFAPRYLLVVAKTGGKTATTNFLLDYR